MNLKLKPIGIIHSPFKTKEEVIRDKDKEAVAEIEVFKEYQQGLEDIDGFSHILILWLFHESEGYSLKVKPLHHQGLRGVFATRHPNRPNPIGVTIVELLERNENLLKVKGIDAFDKTPLLDIKPYTRSDRKEKTKFGWLGEKEKDKRKSK